MKINTPIILGVITMFSIPFGSFDVSLLLWVAYGIYKLLKED